MKARVSTPFKLALLALLVPLPANLCLAASAKSPSSATSAALQAEPEPEIPQSVFAAPANRKEGRNPFYPNSTLGQLQNTKPPSAAVDFALVLNGITSPPKRTAMINGRTFELGEEGEVKLPGGGKAVIKCEDIKADSATVVVNGQRRELRLRFGI